MNLKHGRRAKSRGRLVHIGYGNFVPGWRVVAVLAPDSAPIRRLRQEAAKTGHLVDATFGHRIKAILITDSNHVILSALEAPALRGRLEKENPDEV